MGPVSSAIPTVALLLLVTTPLFALEATNDDLDLDLDVDSPNLADGDDDFQEMMDEDDLPVGPVVRHKWKTSQEGSIVAKAPPSSSSSSPGQLQLAPIPDPTPPPKLTKIQPTVGFGVGFYAPPPSRNLYAAAASATPVEAPARLASLPPPPPTRYPLPTPSNAPQPPPRILQRQWLYQPQYPHPNAYRQQPVNVYPLPQRYTYPYRAPVYSMGK